MYFKQLQKDSLEPVHIIIHTQKVNNTGNVKNASSVKAMEPQCNILITKIKEIIQNRNSA